jgi:molecular chaperone GrpE
MSKKGKNIKEAGNFRKSEKEVKKLKEQLARALADYDNLRKRVEKEREEFGRMANLVFVSRLLPVFDMLKGAQKQLNDSGLEIIIKEFTDVLADSSIKRIEVAKGDDFDENVHEAVEVVKDKRVKNGRIIEEILSGWEFEGGPVIRPTKVKVAKSNKK